ncbi:MAG: hypothetical protein OEO77_07455 [Acidimicrobiia bacterium]|nr:hypothetical protein [Acidimicrobiia bacterium]
MMNPLASRELRTRFRGGRASWFVSVWLLVAAGIGYLTYLLARETASSSFGFQFGGGGQLAASMMGQMMFETLAFILLTGVLFVVPAIASLTIVGERERLTLQLLQVSQLGPVRIVFGKLASSLAYMLLLIVAVGPVLAVPLFIGGVRLRDVFAILGMIVAVAFTVGSIAIWSSARAKSTRGAVGAAYLWVFVLVGMTGLTSIGELYLLRGDTTEFFPANGREVYSLLPNPYLAMVSAAEEPLSLNDFQNPNFFGTSTPFAAVNELLVRRQIGDPYRAFEGGFIEADVAFPEPFNGQVVQPDTRIPQRRGPVWVRALLIYTIISALALWRSSMLVAAPASGSRKFRLPRKEIADAAA